MTFLISLEQVPAATTVALGLGIDEGDALMRLTRWRLADEEPTVYAMSHLPVRVVPTLDPASVRSPTFALHTYLREHHTCAPTHCRAQIFPDVATEPVATPLGLAVGTPTLRLHAQTVHHVVGPVEFAIDWIRADRFSVELSS